VAGAFRRFLTDAFVPAVSVCGVFYFAHHAITGEYGYRALDVRRAEASALAAELEGLRERRAALEHEAKLLSSETLSLDFLDERLRGRMAYLAENDAWLPRAELERLVAEERRQLR